MRVAAVVVNWNQASLTQQCVASLTASTHRPEWVIVVDNGSSVDPTPYVRETCSSAVLVRNATNRGFAAAANQGIERACGHGADAVFVVNNDAVAAAECIAELVRALDADAALAAAGAKTLTQEHPPRIHTAYGVLTYNGPLVQQRGWMEADVTRFNEQVDVDYISGCAMLVRRSAVERIGLLDAEFFAYHEDLDWCTRARRAGYRVAYVPRAVVYHRMHASTGGGYGSAITYLASRNSLLFVRKNATWKQRLRFAAYLCGSLVLEGRFRYQRGEWAGFKLRLRGLRDGLLRRPLPLRELGLESRRDD